MRKIFISGVGGLIGSETAKYYLNQGDSVVGVDNNMRSYFFGKQGDTTGNINHLKSWGKFSYLNADIREKTFIEKTYREWGPFDLIAHTAAQPSHDWAKKEPLTDFEVNALGTLNMLEGFRLFSPKGVFIFTSTNKVYGDNPNKATLTETETRYFFSNNQDMLGISSRGVNEKLSLDQCTHSVFGASKVAADVMVQEYGRYFGLKTGVFRGGCLTGPQHSAVKLHGFLTYLVECALQGKEYTIIGYQGKQVRDQIHSLDVVRAFDHFFTKPIPGSVYNLGGGKQNSASILEVIEMLKADFGLKLKLNYVDTPRVGDHICYYTDLLKFKNDYKAWTIKINLKQIINEIIQVKKHKR